MRRQDCSYILIDSDKKLWAWDDCSHPRYLCDQIELVTFELMPSHVLPTVHNKNRWGIWQLLFTTWWSAKTTLKMIWTRCCCTQRSRRGFEKAISE